RLAGPMRIRQGTAEDLAQRAAARYFPEEMVTRPKEGFLMPVTQWMLGALQPYVRQTLAPARLAQHGFFRPDTVAALVDRLYQPGCDYRDVNRVVALIA